MEKQKKILCGGGQQTKLFLFCFFSFLSKAQNILTSIAEKQISEIFCTKQFFSFLVSYLDLLTQSKAEKAKILISIIIITFFEIEVSQLGHNFTIWSLQFHLNFWNYFSELVSISTFIFVSSGIFRFNQNTVHLCCYLALLSMVFLQYLNELSFFLCLPSTKWESERTKKNKSPRNDISFNSINTAILN